MLSFGFQMLNMHKKEKKNNCEIEKPCELSEYIRGGFGDGLLVDDGVEWAFYEIHSFEMFRVFW